MKIQIIKIIPCLLAGFILSACVGAVNVPSEIADKVIKTTDPDPVVEKDTIVIVDDKEPEPEPEPEPQPEPEPKPELEAEPEPIVIDPEIALINICIMDDNGGDASCEPTVKNHPCIRDPFGGVCHIQFADYYETAQANRIAFCIIEKNAEKSLCSGANIAMNNCIEDPFADECKAQTGFTDYYQTAIGNRIAHCQDTYEPRPSYYGTPTICKNVCNINGDPFGEMCSDSNNESIRAQKIIFCEMAVNANEASCVPRPNTITFLRSLTTPPPTKPNAETPQNEFLQGTATGLDFGDTRDHRYRNYRSSNPNPSVNTLTLADNSLGGDSTDGVAFFRGNIGRDTYYYAGILSDTDLGASVSKKSGTAIWNGTFRVVSSLGGLNVDNNFALSINFGAGEQAGTISASFYNYSLTGNFNSRGIITGTVRREFVLSNRINILDGVMIGLIGQEGAVGAFISDESNQSRGYSGGFVARPPAE